VTGALSPSGPSVVGLGGGHGLAATLAAARRYAGAITAVVSVADDGGSSGRLREAFGMPAPGDLRRCLAALAADPDGPWARAFGWRFDRAELEGHALGNLVLAGLTETLGSFTAAVEEAGRLLATCGLVLPATDGPVRLTATLGELRLVGQTAIQELGGPVDLVAIEPADASSPDGVARAIREADQVVLGPGSLFTSVLAVTAAPAVRSALEYRRQSGAGGVVFVCNLRPSKETVGFDVAAHLDALSRHGVRPDVILADTSGMELGEVSDGADVVLASLARPNGWSHDVARLAEGLGGLVAHPR
jgi:uncharacterized cofD-like protein